MFAVGQLEAVGVAVNGGGLGHLSHLASVEPCAHVTDAPCGDALSQLYGLRKGAVFDLAPERGGRERQGRGAGRVLGVAHQLRLAYQRGIWQLVKAGDGCCRVLRSRFGCGVLRLLLTGLGGLCCLGHFLFRGAQ